MNFLYFQKLYFAFHETVSANDVYNCYNAKEKICLVFMFKNFC